MSDPQTGNDHTPGPCGCIGEIHRGEFRIIYCPTHAAAPDLLAEAEGLWTLVRAVRDMLDAPSGAVATVAGLEAIVPTSERLDGLIRDAAIAKARGELSRHGWGRGGDR